MFSAATLDCPLGKVWTGSNGYVAVTADISNLVFRTELNYYFSSPLTVTETGSCLLSSMKSVITKRYKRCKKWCLLTYYEHTSRKVSFNMIDYLLLYSLSEPIRQTKLVAVVNS